MKVSLVPVVVGHHPGDDGAGRVGVQPDRLGVGDQGDVGMLEGRADAQHLGVGLGVDQAGEAVAGRGAQAAAVGRVGLVEHDAAGRVERVVAGGGEVVGELLDARLVGDRRMGVGGAGGRLGRVLAADPVHLVALLGLGVVGLHVVVADRPGGRDAVVVLQLAEVLAAQPVQRGPVQLGGAADEVVDLRLERLAARRRTRCRRRCSGCRRTRRRPTSSGARGPASRPAPAAGCACPSRPGAGQGAAAGPGADDDHVIVRSSLQLLCPLVEDDASPRPRSGPGGRTPAGSCRGGGRCRCRTPRRSSPSGEAMRSRRSIRSRARSCSPTTARADTSQNEQIRKVPSLPLRPSSVSSVL